jgi:short-subunit dehydrogenase
MSQKAERVLITGASSGLGEALARRYAAAGRMLVLWGRDQARLDSVAAACRAAGADVAVRSLDLEDVDAAIAALREDDEAGAIGTALFVAGQGDIRGPGNAVEDPYQVKRLAMVNFVAPCAMATALGERMAARRSGSIVLVGSAAAFHALPFAASYAASKAGLARFAEALRIGLAPHGVRVTLVSPGFIDTAAGRRVPGPKPLIMPAAVVAARIARAAGRGRPHLILPRPFGWLRVLDRLLPRAFRDRALRGLAPR